MEPILTHTESTHVDASPQAVYDLVSDITRTGEWSPICATCWWDEKDEGAGAAGPAVGARFTGRNVKPDRTWETRSTVVAAEPGREFAWEVGEGLVRWGYAMEPAGNGTELTESWEFLPAGLEMFRTRMGDDAEHQIAVRAADAHAGIPATLAAIKRVAERPQQ
ncbi:MAG: SRPBCC family protein [Actinomycetota bacterium]|nr:SRPBCC family protein [Actinomycetota bacterium]